MDTLTTVRKHRIKQGLTIPELASSSGVSPSTLDRIEAAERGVRIYDPRLSQVVKLSCALGVGLASLVPERCAHDVTVPAKTTGTPQRRATSSPETTRRRTKGA